MKNQIKKLLREELEAQEILSYKKWVMANKELVHIDTLRSLIAIRPEDMLKPEIQQRKQEMKENIINFFNSEIKQNECFHNAGKTFDFLTNNGYDVKFVLGIMVENGKIFGHAWNEIFGRYYDLTAELSSGSKNKYYSLFKYNNPSDIRSLSVFNPNEVCKYRLNINGEDYDVNGYCSVLPEYLKLKGV